MSTRSIIEVIEEKITKGIRLSDEDALLLFQSPHLTEIGVLADKVNRSKNRDVIFYNVNRHINPTNICVLSCRFCAYSRKPGEDGAYAYSIDEIVTKAGEAVAQGATEIHMVGGLHPRWRLKHYLDIIREVKSAFPTLHVKAFTVVELDWMARRERLAIKDVLAQLVEAGLGSLPGGGAEIFHPEIRDAICDTKVDAEKWLATHRTAHEMGLMSNATMLYGHVENFSHRVDHMRRLRELQDETNGFNAFIPLSFQPHQNEMGIDRYTYGFDDLKTVAVARLYLDNFQHIKAYWIMLGQDIAQLALAFGANDLDGTVIEEKISRMAGGRAGMELSRRHLQSIINKAERRAQERDTLYHPVGEPAENILAASLLSNESTDEFLAKVAHSDLNRLGQEACSVRSRNLRHPPGSFLKALVVTPKKSQTLDQEIQQRNLREVASKAHAVVIDFSWKDGTPIAVEVGKLLELIWKIRQTAPELEVIGRGLKSLWHLAQSEGVRTYDLLKRLREAGVGVIYSSPFESETDLTTSEIVDIHGQVHECGLNTVAKVELSASASGDSAPMWQVFLGRLKALSELQMSTTDESGILGVSIETAPDSFVTPYEYLRALALARITLSNIPNIIAPIMNIPILTPMRGLGASGQQFPSEKIAPLALCYGANDLGVVDAERWDHVSVMEEIRSTAYAAALRDPNFTTQQAKNGQVFSTNSQLRHMPDVLA